MITNAEIIEIGTILKPHGIKGEMVVEMDVDVDINLLRCVVLEMDGINVPFFIDSVRPKASTTYLVHIDGFDTDLQAKQICGKKMYGLRNDIASLAPDDYSDDDESLYASDIIGYNVVDTAGVRIGVVDDFDDTTENVLLIVAPVNADDDTIYIPFVNEFIADVDTENNTITVDLPEGLI